MKDGYKQGGASHEVLTAMEDRLVQAFPHSDEAYQIVSDRWEKAHTKPDPGDAAAWAKYHREYREALKGWIARFTESPELQHEESFDSLWFDPDVPAEEGLRAVDDYLTYVADYKRPELSDYRIAAVILLDRNWQPQRAFDLLRNADNLMDQWHERMIGDNLSAEAEDHLAFNELLRRQDAAGCVLVAARLAEQPQAADRLKAFVERELPAKTWPRIEEQYWKNRGRLAALEGRKADALAYYQKALQMRKNPPDAFEGYVYDDVGKEARALWKQLGGTETAWNLWSKPRAAKIQELAESGWQKPTKAMPGFELADQET
jgi:hypothetical protein